MTLVDFPLKKVCNKSNSVSSPLLIPEDMTLLAVGAFTYTFEWFGCTDQPSSIECLLKKASNECSNLNKDEYTKLHDGKQDTYFFDYCFNAAHMISNLSKGFGLKLNRKINVSNKLNGQGISWALGAMIFETNQANIKECSL